MEALEALLYGFMLIRNNLEDILKSVMTLMYRVSVYTGHIYSYMDTHENLLFVIYISCFSEVLNRNSQIEINTSALSHHKNEI